MATILHRPWDELEDTLTIPRVEALQAEWRRHPPVHELFANFVGYEAPKTMKEAIRAGAMGPEDFLRFVQATGGKEIAPKVN